MHHVWIIEKCHLGYLLMLFLLIKENLGMKLICNFFFLDHLLYFIVSNSGCKLRCQEKTHCWEADDTGESAPTEGQL